MKQNIYSLTICASGRNFNEVTELEGLLVILHNDRAISHLLSEHSRKMPKEALLC